MIPVIHSIGIGYLAVYMIRKILKTILFSFIPFIFFIFITELCLRFIYPQNLRNDPPAHNMKSAKGYLLKPNYSGTHSRQEYSTTWKINSLGLRNEDFNPNDSKKNILFLGDSMTFGFGVENNETFSAKANELLKNNGYKDYRIINGGLAGASTYDSLFVYNYYYEMLKPQFVFLFMYPGNDIEDNLLYFGRGKRIAKTSQFDLKKWLGYKSHLYSLITLRFDRLLRKLHLRKADYIFFPFCKKEYSQYEISALEKTKTALQTFKTDTEKNGVKLIIVILPDRLQTSINLWEDSLKILNLDGKEYDPLKPANEIIKICNELEIDFFDLFTYMKDNSHYYYPIDGHLNPKGHQYIAKIIFDLLLKKI